MQIQRHFAQEDKGTRNVVFIFFLNLSVSQRRQPRWPFVFIIHFKEMVGRRKQLSLYVQIMIIEGVVLNTIREVIGLRSD